MSEPAQEQKEAMDYLRAEAKKHGMTMNEFLNGPIKNLLDTAWKIQKEKGSVSIDELAEKLGSVEPKK